MIITFLDIHYDVINITIAKTNIDKKDVHIKLSSQKKILQDNIVSGYTNIINSLKGDVLILCVSELHLKKNTVSINHKVDITRFINYFKNNIINVENFFYKYQNYSNSNWFYNIFNKYVYSSTQTSLNMDLISKRHMKFYFNFVKQMDFREKYISTSNQLLRLVLCYISDKRVLAKINENHNVCLLMINEYETTISISNMKETIGSGTVYYDKLIYSDIIKKINSISIENNISFNFVFVFGKYSDFTCFRRLSKFFRVLRVYYINQLEKKNNFLTSNNTLAKMSILDFVKNQAKYREIKLEKYMKNIRNKHKINRNVIAILILTVCILFLPIVPFNILFYNIIKNLNNVCLEDIMQLF